MPVLSLNNRLRPIAALLLVAGFAGAPAALLAQQGDQPS